MVADVDFGLCAFVGVGLYFDLCDFVSPVGKVRIFILFPVIKPVDGFPGPPQAAVPYVVGRSQLGQDRAVGKCNRMKIRFVFFLVVVELPNDLVIFGERQRRVGAFEAERCTEAGGRAEQPVTSVETAISVIKPFARVLRFCIFTASFGIVNG